MIKRIFERLEKIEISAFASISIVFLIAIARYVMEVLLSVPGNGELEYNRLSLVVFNPFASFYFSLFLYFLVGQKLFLKKISYAPILIGLLLALLPPLVDGVIFNEKPEYFYPEPNLLFLDEGMSKGELFAIYLGILLFGAYIQIRRNGKYVLFPALFFAWFVLQLFASVHPALATGAFPDIIQNLPFTKGLAEMSKTHTAIIFFATRFLLFVPALFYLDRDFRRFALYRASRFFLFAALSFFAISLFKIPALIAAVLFFANGVAFLMLFMLNTRGDETEDRVNKRPFFSISALTWLFVPIMLLASFVLLYMANVPSSIFGVLALEIAISVLYNAPFKLKNFFVLAYAVEGLMFALIFISYAIAVVPWSWGVAEKFAVCLAVFSMGCALKDYKDVAGDRKAGVRTAFTVLGGSAAEKFWLGFRVLLVTGPIFFIALESGILPFSQCMLNAFFALAAGYVLFSAKLEREQLVNYYIVLFSAWLLASGVIAAYY